MTGYTDIIRHYAMDDRFSGELPDPDGVGEVGLDAGEAGKRLAVRFMLRVAGGQVAAVRFQVFGCGFTIAACAAAAELAEGGTLEDVAAIDAAAIDAALGGLPGERGYCAELATEALQGAVAGARDGSRAVRHATRAPSETAHGPRITAGDPVYRDLMGSRAPTGVAAEDRHLFACLLAVAAGEPFPAAAALGLGKGELDAVLNRYFPDARRDLLNRAAETGATRPPPAPNPDVLALLLDHAAGGNRRESTWLARIVAARSTLPGHLWVAMGLFERPELSGAIRRHLPTLATANAGNMRWKRFVFKQVCDLGGGVLCKAPNCGVCSDYALCFAEEE